MSTIKDTIEKTTGIAKLSDPDSVSKRVIEAYPCYSPMGGITFRIERSGDNPALWIDASVSEATEIALDILSMVNEVKKSNLPEDPDLAEVKQMYPKEQTPAKVYVPREWSVGRWQENVDPIDKKDKVPVFNNKDQTLVWFETAEAAYQIVEHVNGR